MIIDELRLLQKHINFLRNFNDLEIKKELEYCRGVRDSILSILAHQNKTGVKYL